MPSNLTTTLEDLKPGSEALIAQVQGEKSFQQRLFDLGLVPGTAIKLIRKAMFGDPLEIRLRGYHLAIRRNDARKILLQGLR